EHAPRRDRGDLTLERHELRVTTAPLHHLARLAPEQDSDAPFEQLEACAPAQSTILRFLRGEVRLAAVEVAQPAMDFRGLLGVSRIGMRGVCGLHQLERAADVLAEELQTHRLQRGVDVPRIGGLTHVGRTSYQSNGETPSAPCAASRNHSGSSRLLCCKNRSNCAS